MESVTLFPEYPELKLYKREPEDIKTEFVDQVHLGFFLRHLPWSKKRHIINWKLNIDVNKVVIGEPVFHPSEQSMSVHELSARLPELYQQTLEHDPHLSEADIAFRAHVQLASLWTAHQGHYSFTINSTSGHFLMKAGTPVYASGSGFIFYSQADTVKPSSYTSLKRIT